MSVEMKEIKENLEEQLAQAETMIQESPEEFRYVFQQALETKELDLSEMGLDDDTLIEHVIPFLKLVPSITQLNLSCNAVGNIGAQALAEIHTITSVNLNENEVGEQGCKALAENKTLTSLIISHNGLNDACAVALAKSTTITTLDVGINEIDDAGAKALSENASIKSLDISSNQLNDADAMDLAKNNNFTFLNIANNRQLGMMGRTAIIDLLQNRHAELEATRKAFQAFLMGTHPRVGSQSSILIAFNQQSAEEELLRKIFSHKPEAVTPFEYGI